MWHQFKALLNKTKKKVAINMSKEKCLPGVTALTFLPANLPE